MLSLLKTTPAIHLKIEEVLANIPKETVDDGGKWLHDVIQALRPQHQETISEVIKRWEVLKYTLRTSPEILLQTRNYLRRLIEKHNYVRLFTEVGVAVHASFTSEVFKRIGEKILPPLLDPNEMLDLLEECFPNRDDHQWIKAIPSSLWVELWQLLDADGAITSSGTLFSAIAESVLILSHRIVAMGLEPEV
ncbi:MAG: hypothetical protein ACK424_02040, partial [Candidatus Thermochlorobacter sp.]